MDLFAHTTSLSRRQSAEVSLNYLGRLFDSNIELRLFLRHRINRITPSECHCNGVPTGETCKILKKFETELFFSDVAAGSDGYVARSATKIISGDVSTSGERSKSP